MKNIFLFLLLVPFFLQAQMEKVIVETYYVSDTNDASDTTGGILTPGSTTYRVYIDLAPGVKLRKVYGDANHALKIASTELFFNNSVDGQTLGKDFSKNRYSENTVGLDSWLTLGQVTKTSARTYFGVPKVNDTTGSFIGGVNNDGGSSAVRGGLISNGDASAGIPVTTADGFDTMSVVPGNWASFGILDNASNDDSTIFGSLKAGKEFISRNMAVQNSGVLGVVPDSNQVLVAQLTTKGELSFELNIEVEDTNGAIIKYVANGDTLASGERVSPLLTFPPVCGCNNPDYLEFSSNYACGEPSRCKNLIVFGCTDVMACNYDPGANFAIPSMCCYPGSCNGLDIALVCPEFAATTGIEYDAPINFEVYPNPAQDRLTVQFPTVLNDKAGYTVYDYLGRVVLQSANTIPVGNKLELDIATLDMGMYLLHISTGNSIATKVFVKN